MSTIKRSDYLEWTQKSCPNLTASERSWLSGRLSEMQLSLAHLQGLTAIHGPWQGATCLPVLSSIKRSLPPGWRWTAGGIPEDFTAVLSPREPVQDCYRSRIANAYLLPDGQYAYVAHGWPSTWTPRDWIKLPYRIKVTRFK
jgi:hypothetical protein